MRNGEEILEAYNNQSEQSFIDGDFLCLSEMIDKELDAITDQRDELLAALQELMQIESRGRIMPIGKEWDNARAAIAKCEA